jgi:arabinogalactan oligomer / maltooligosaccharide transport system substrate-binding protein
VKRLTSLLILLLLLTGCAKPPQEAPTIPAPVVITLWHSYQGEAAKGLEQACQELTKSNPGYQLQVVYVTSDKYFINLTRTFAAGKGPDIFLVAQNQLPDLYVGGYLQPLDNLYDTGKYFKASVEGLSFNGSVLAVPKNVKVPLLAYNRDLVPDQPQSLEQVLDSANKISKGQGIGLAGDVSSPFLIGQIYAGYGGQLFASDQKPNLNSSESVAFLQEITALAGVKAGTYDSPSSKAMLGGGATPFGLFDSGEINAYKGLGKNLGYAAIPGPGGKEANAYVQAEGFAISANCNFPKQAVAAAVYLTSQQALAKYSVPQGEFPADPTAYEQNPLKDDGVAQTVKHLATLGSGYPLDSRSKLILPLLSQAIKDVLNGINPNDAAQNGQNQALKALGVEQP